MKPARAIVLITVAIFLSFSLLPSEAAAFSPPPPVMARVLAAGYFDLDSDSNSDDILTEFEVYVSQYLPFQISYIYAFLEMPSGRTYACTLKVTGHYSHLEIGLGWINTVSESGWYWFYFYVEIVEPTYSEWAYDDMCFDPPTEGVPGPPLVRILTVESSP